MRSCIPVRWKMQNECGRETTRCNFYSENDCVIVGDRWHLNSTNENQSCSSFISTTDCTSIDSYDHQYALSFMYWEFEIEEEDVAPFVIYLPYRHSYIFFLFQLRCSDLLELKEQYWYWDLRIDSSMWCECVRTWMNASHLQSDTHSLLRHGISTS